MPRTRSVAWSELKLGIVGVAALTLATMLVLAVGGESGFFTEKYPLKMQLNDVQGLKPGAIVRLSGKEVGQVTAVEFAGARIDVSLEILEEVRPLITTNSMAAVGSLSLLGEPIIDVRASSEGSPLADWSYITSSGSGGPFGELQVSAETSLAQVAELLTDIRDGRGTLGKLVTDDQLYTELNGFISSAEAVTVAMRTGDGTISQLMNDPAAANALKASLENLQTTTARINAGEGALGRFLNDEAMGNSLAATMANLEQATAKMNTGEGTMAKLVNDSAVYDRLDNLMARMGKVLEGLETGQGTAGQLLQDQRLYESINSAISEMHALLADIRADPKKFLRVSVSIF